MTYLSRTYLIIPFSSLIRHPPYHHPSSSSFSALNEITNLSWHTKLTNLRLSDPMSFANPVCLLANYRPFLLRNLQTLQTLDGDELYVRKLMRQISSKKREIYSNNNNNNNNSKNNNNSSKSNNHGGGRGKMQLPHIDIKL